MIFLATIQRNISCISAIFVTKTELLQNNLNEIFRAENYFRKSVKGEIEVLLMLLFGVYSLRISFINEMKTISHDTMALLNFNLILCDLYVLQKIAFCFLTILTDVFYALFNIRIPSI